MQVNVVGVCVMKDVHIAFTESRERKHMLDYCNR